MTELKSDMSRSGLLPHRIKVIGAGYSRTGTVSFANALETLLHGPVIHTGSASLERNESYIRSWISILNPAPKTTQQDIKTTLARLHTGYIAMTDLPAIMFTEELCELYPDAVVICTVRDPVTWWRSMQDVLDSVDMWWLDAVFGVMPTLRWFRAWRAGIATRRKVVYPPGTKLSQDLLEIHNEYVKRVVPPERLFFFNVKEGWEPLCKILDLPVPDGPFPHANDKEAIANAFKGMVRKGFMTWASILAAGVGALAVGWLSVSRSRM